MTAPPGGPYGPDQPQWGAPPPGVPYQYPPGGGDQYQPGVTYPYPPTGPFPNQQYTQPGQQFPPGWQGVPYPPYPPGPPPGGPRSKLPWFILGGVALLGVFALVAILVIGLTRDGKPKAGPVGPTGPSSAPTSQSANSDQNASSCTPNVSGGEKPPGDTIAAGKLSFPSTAAPGWAVFSDDQTPNLIGALGVAQNVPNANQWAMAAEVGITNFVPNMDVAAQASKLMECVANGPGYQNANPTLGPAKKSSITVDGVNAARVDADVTIADTTRGVKGDSVVIIAVDTKPATIFMGASPIGDAASAGIINRVVAALRVTKS